MGNLRHEIRALLKTKADMDAFVRREHLDASGEAVISVQVTNSPVSPYSMGRQRALCPEVLSYIDAKAYPIPLKYTLRINFVGNFTQDEKAVIRELFQEHYSLELTDKCLDLKYLWRRVVGLVILGSVVLSFAVQMSGDFIAELFSIVGSFALWEAAGAVILEHRELKTHYLSAGQIATAEVDFSEPSEYK